MEDAGVQVRWFRPLRRFRPGQVNHRTHRKVMIVDEAIGVHRRRRHRRRVARQRARTRREWRDTHFRIQGPAVDGLRAAFLDNWVETDPSCSTTTSTASPSNPSRATPIVQCVRGASETGDSDVVHPVPHALLQLAEQRLRITTAYFVPDDEIIERLVRRAPNAGVEVELLLPGPHADKRFVQLAGEATYAALLERGVEIWTFQPSMLHAKIMTVDGIVANIGSANLNARSTSLDEEINVVAIDARARARSSTSSSTKTSSAASASSPAGGRNAHSRSGLAEQAVRPVRRWF